MSASLQIPIGNCNKKEIDPALLAFLYNNPNVFEDKSSLCDMVEEFNALKKLAEEEPDVPITYQDIINCLKPENKPGHTYKITMSVDDPTNGSNGSSAGGTAGHAFITLQETNANGNMIASYTFGFYPKCIPELALSNLCPGELGNDEGHEADVSWAFDISFSEYMNVLNNIPTTSNRDWTFIYNCTSFAHNALSNAGITFTNHMLTPNAWADYMRNNLPTGGGKNGVSVTSPQLAISNICK